MPVSTSPYRVPANSLLITLIVSLVIGLICLLLILLAYNELRVRADLLIGDKLDRNLRSSINRVLEDDPAVGTVSQASIDLFGQGNDSAFIREEVWGVYDVASIEVRDGGRLGRKSFFFGSLLPDSLDGCLFLAEHQRSLSLVGSTRLIGTARLPKAGVKAGYIDQRGYDNTELVEGSTQRSKDSFPALRQPLLQYYITLSYKDSSRKTSDPLPDSLNRSFADSAVTFHERGDLVLSGVNWSGHILVISDSVIEVKADAHLDNVILSAPVIRFRQGFSGRVQAYCSDSLIVEKGCNLYYPSSLVLVKKAGNTTQPRLVTGTDCLLEGVLLAYCEKGDPNKIYSEIGSNTIVRGVVYSCGYLCLKGTVYGATLTDYFIYRTSSIIYENYLVDARLDRGRLASWYVGPVVFTDPKKNRVLQWVK